MRIQRVLLTAGALLLFPLAPAFAQNPPAPPRLYGENLPTEPAPMEKLDRDRVRVGKILVDTAKREATVPGKVNGVDVLEFIANTRGGFKAYESAFELETDAVTFNLAMILLGLDKANAVPSRQHFDPLPPQGDPVEVWVEWQSGGKKKRMRAEELLVDVETKKRFPKTNWVYVGSVFLEDGRYLAELDGVLIGFVHTPAPIIECPLPNGVGRFGFINLDPKLNLKGGTPILVTIKSLKKPTKK